MKTCGKCGAASPDASVFCGECGASLHEHDTAIDPSDPGRARSGRDAPPPTDDSGAPPAPVGAGAGTVPGSPVSEAMRAPDPPPAPAVRGSSPPIHLAPPAGAPRGPAKPKHVAPGTVVDQKYRIDRVIGEGGMGIVYLATDVHTGVEVVLKSIRNELAHRPDVRDRTMAEGRAIARIDHPNVVHLKAVVVEGQNLWLVMQYVDGESLEDRIARHVLERVPMPLGEALRILRQVLAGMGAVHKGGVIHRDLKPGNILIRAQDGTAKVSDFGIAKGEEDARAGRGQTRGIIGSLWYMSPEQVTGRRDLDKRVDVYALGIMLYEMLVGHVPFDAEGDYEIMRMHTSSPVPLVSAVRKDVPRAIDDVIQKACAKDREQRFASCEAFLEAIDRAQPVQPTVEARAASARPQSTRTATVDAELLPVPAVGRGWTIFAVTVLLLGGGAAALIGLGVVPVPGFDDDERRPTPTASPTATAAATLAPTRPVTTAAPPTAPTAPAPPPLESLAGRWTSENGREFEAVMVPDAVEFRVVDPAQFPGQDYQAGEARFVLRPVPNEAAFSVEDRIRPLPPAGHTYSANARSTCLGLWSSAGGRPLRATLEGARLSVDFAQIEPDNANFVTDKEKVTGCRKLGSLKASRVPGVLRRP